MTATIPKQPLPAGVNLSGHMVLNLASIFSTAGFQFILTKLRVVEEALESFLDLTVNRSEIKSQFVLQFRMKLLLSCIQSFFEFLNNLALEPCPNRFSGLLARLRPRP
jgi:hypothetical protein